LAILFPGPVDPKFQVGGVATTNNSSSQKTRLLSFIWYKNLDRSFFRFVAMHTFDRWTDRQTDSFLVPRSPCIQCSAVKLLHQDRIGETL